MNSLQEIKELFPITFHVTQSIIDNADVYNTRRCIGALSFKQAMAERNIDVETWRDWGWGDEFGAQRVDDGDFEIYASTLMMEITKPMDVEFTFDHP